MTTRTVTTAPPSFPDLSANEVCMTPRQHTGAIGRTLLLKTSLFLAIIFSLPDSAAWAAGEFDLKDFTWRTINFVILATLLFYLAAKKIRDFLRQRREDVMESLRKAQEERRQAEHLYEETMRRLAEAEKEVLALTSMIESQGKSEREKIMAEGEALARKIREEAEARVTQELRQARQSLLEEATRLSIAWAEKILREKMTPEDQTKLINEALERMRNEVNAGGQDRRRWS